MKNPPRDPIHPSRTRSLDTAAAGIFLLLAFVAGCLTPGPQITPPVVWATGPSHRVEPSQRVDIDSAYFDHRTGAVRAVGAVNETVGIELVIRAAEEAVSGIELAISDFASEDAVIPGENVRAYRHRHLTVDSYPNWYLRLYGLREPRAIPDALVPTPLSGRGPPRTSTAGAPFSVAAGRNEPIYLEITIPPHALPGQYRATLTLTNRDGLRAQTPLELHVYDVYLKDAAALPVPVRVHLAPLIAAHSNLDPRNIRTALEDPGVRSAVHEAFKLLHAHGLSPYTDELFPRFSQDQGGAVVFDWEEYDAFCGPLIDGSAYESGRPAFAWPMPANLSQPNPLHYDGMDAAGYAAILREYLQGAAAHFEQIGWLDRNFVFYDFPTRTNPAEQEFSSFRRLAATTRQADPRLAILSALIPQSMQPFGWVGYRHEDLTADIDVWGTPARYHHPETLARLHQSGKRTWLSPDRPPFSGSLAVEAPLTHARSLPWQAFLQGHEALWLRQSTDWPRPLIEIGSVDLYGQTDGWLFYPGNLFGLDQPVPSARLKQLRTGLHEYQYLRLLEQEGRSETARLLARSLIKAAGADAYGNNYQDGLPGRRVDEPGVWDLARRILCEEADDAVRDEPSKQFNKEANRAAWSEFLARTRKLDAWAESARIKADPRRDRSGYLATVDITVRNELRTSVRGKLSFAATPPGTTPVGDEPSVGPLGEMGVASRQLSAMMLQLPFCDLDGHFTQPILFNAEPTGKIEVPAVFSIIRARRSDRPIRVDGNLSDWPPGFANIAGDFRIINPARGPMRPRAESQTVAYFCRDDETLYIGIRAASPHGALERQGVLSDRVEYDDLWPTSGDLVEIVLDPTGAATKIDDLYHIVIKSTGDPVFERGVSIQPPIGEVRPWPGRRPAYSVVMDEEGWTAELAIPIASLGPTTGANRVWGVNLARLEPTRGEYSDWARAPRYCYDPRTLGNLVWSD